MKKYLAVVALIAALAPIHYSQAAVQTEPTQVEQALGIDFRQVLCSVGGWAANTFLGPRVGSVVAGGAEVVGLCPAGTAAGASNSPAPFPAIGGTTEVKPGLQFKVLKVAGTGEATTVTAATPDTVYAQNEGIVLLMAYNSPGYLQVWSVDDNTETLLEGVLLSGSTASALTLPDKARGGFYRFTTSGGTDVLRLRFLPCRHGSNQALEFTANSFVAAQVATQTPPAVEQMTDTLPSCPFVGTFNAAAENDGFFRRPQVQAPVYNASLGTHAAVLTRGGLDNATSLLVDVRLKRN
ncbi:hypothetical protein [Brevundimonas sp.]|uniref:hypothetical protein n=1 Tax=Brevundimonas sp. TaxID=1871086 RepID=UPI002D73704D|nr:hypothetical protein [Brevundimonas sp.]HYC68847.1 hypothetical protein [Brevundimonas sp.]